MTLSATADATPATRDRLVDLVRAASILVVVLGHWTMAALEPGPARGIRVRNILEVTPWAHALTWVLQVMPLFFLAAGFTNALALSRGTRTRGAVVAGRVDRVLAPTLVFVGVWLVLAWALVGVGIPAALVDSAGAAAAMPLWFLAVYLLLALVAPAQYAVHQRLPWLLVTVLPPLALLLDQAQGTGLAAVGYLNYLVVFGFCQELGLLYADGRLARVQRRWWTAAAATAVAALVLLTGPGPYPVSMIGLPGQDLSNMLPPSVCVLVVAVLQLALLMLARPALTEWAGGRRAWRAVVVVNARVMTVFLWHITGLVLAAGTAYQLGLALPPIGSGRWWLEKPLWILAAALLTAGLVVAFGRFERVTARRTPAAVDSGSGVPGPGVTAGAAAAVASAVLAVAGLTMVASAGFADPFARGGVALAGLTFYPAAGAVLLAAAWLLSRLPRA